MIEKEPGKKATCKRNQGSHMHDKSDVTFGSLKRVDGFLVSPWQPLRNESQEYRPMLISTDYIQRYVESKIALLTFANIY